jgi:chitin disaccharide deacetylase
MVIINADDFGYSVDVNDAIVYCFKHNIISSTTIMVNMPCFADAISKAKINGFDDKIGLHFNLTKGMPLSEPIKCCKRFCGPDGSFIYKRNEALILTIKEMQAIYIEFCSQIMQLKQVGINPTHVDSHHHVHTEFFIFLSICRALKRNDIKKLRISRNIDCNSKWMIYKRMFNVFLHLNGFKTTSYFDSLYAFREEKEVKYASADLELMCHPVCLNGAVVDSISGECLRNQIYSSMGSYKDL